METIESIQTIKKRTETEAILSDVLCWLEDLLIDVQTCDSSAVVCHLSTSCFSAE